MTCISTTEMRLYVWIWNWDIEKQLEKEQNIEMAKQYRNNVKTNLHCTPHKQIYSPTEIKRQLRSIPNNMGKKCTHTLQNKCNHELNRNWKENGIESNQIIFFSWIRRERGTEERFVFEMECEQSKNEQTEKTMAINVLAAGDEVSLQSSEKSKCEILWHFDIPNNQRCTAEFNEQFIVIALIFL